MTLAEFDALLKASAKLVPAPAGSRYAASLKDTMADEPQPEPEMPRTVPVLSAQAYIQLQKDQLVMAAIEESARQSEAQFEKLFEQRMQDDWAQTLAQLQADLGEERLGQMHDDDELPRAIANETFQALDETPAPARRTTAPRLTVGAGLAPKVEAYGAVVRRLSELRLSGTELDLVGELERVCRHHCARPGSPGDLAPAAQAGALVWPLLRLVLGPGPLPQGRWRGAPALEQQAAAVRGGIAFYEQQHWARIERACAQHVRVAALGGRPTVHDKVAGYLRVVAGDAGPGADFLGGLETRLLPMGRPAGAAGGPRAAELYPVWAHVYHLLRGGKHYEMADWARARVEDGVLVSEDDVALAQALQLWRQQRPGRLPAGSPARLQLCGLWNSLYAPLLAQQRLGGDSDVAAVPLDPYKLAILRLVAQCGDDAAPLAGVHALDRELDNVMWARLYGAAAAAADGTLSGGETPVGDAGAAAMAALGDLAIAHADGTAARALAAPPAPHEVVLALLACGQFERAVAHALDNAATAGAYADGVHVAIVLAYYGCLHVPAAPERAERLSVSDVGPRRTVFNFAALMAEYARPLRASHVQLATHYILLAGLYGSVLDDSTPESERQHALFVHAQLIKMALLSDEHMALLLGHVTDSQTRPQGLVWRFARLACLGSYADYCTRIVRRAAEHLQHHARDDNLARVVQVYYLAGDTGKVLEMINRRLSDEVMRRGNGLLQAARAEAAGVPGAAASFPATAADASALVVQAREVLDFFAHMAFASPLEAAPPTPGPARVGAVPADAVATTQTLIELSAVVGELHAREFARALGRLVSLELFPLVPAGSADPPVRLVHERAAALRRLDELVLRLVPNLLILAMFALEQLHAQAEASPYVDSARQRQMRYWVGQAEQLMGFAGSAQFRMPSEAYGLLNQLFVCMT